MSVECKHCADCNKTITSDDEIEVDVEIVERGQRKTEAITVCRECYNTLYRSDYMSELYFYEFGSLDITDKPMQL